MPQKLDRITEIAYSSVDVDFSRNDGFGPPPDLFGPAASADRAPIPMLNIQSGTPLPATVSQPMAWAAFTNVFSLTDWRLRIATLTPISVEVEHDERFGRHLADAESWKTFDQAKGWIANRILLLTRAIGKTYVRRLSLQVPATLDGRVADALLANLKGRIEDTVRHELVAHFEQSVIDWEREALDLVSRMEDPTDRWRMTRYLGLDQRVSIDAARKAIHFVFYRTGWNLVEKDGWMVLTPDWRFDVIRSSRCSLVEQTRARSLVARCIEALCDEHQRLCRSGLDVAPLTRTRLKTEIDQRFAEDGVCGLIDLSLAWDRARHFMFLPTDIDEPLRDLVNRQERRLLV